MANSDSTEWTFIGAGNMASSLIGGLISSGANANQITVIDINADARLKCSKTFDVNTADDIASIKPASSIVIAVKPNGVESVCKSLATIKPDLVVSVAAGVRTDSMRSWLPAGTAIVRCMPNTPALLGLGATALFANESCSDKHKHQGDALLATAGIIRWVTKEAELDAITALSGSGPAYFFYLIEHMAKTGEQLGLDAQLSQEFAIETAFGAACMARAKEFPPQVLRENVTSKGGTTAAALSVFDQESLPEIISNAMQAAQQRAAELGNAFDS